MTVKEIVFDYLATRGYGGLCNDDCGCPIDDLMPCCSNGCAGCVPGYRQPDPDNKGEFIIVEEKTCAYPQHEIEALRGSIEALHSEHSARRMLATIESNNREIAALRGLIDTLSFCYDQPVSDLALMVIANKERDARERL